LIAFLYCAFVAYLNGLEVNTTLAEEARTKLLSESGAGPLTDGAAAEQEELKAKTSPMELTQEEETALETLEAKEFVQYVLGLL